MSKKEILHYATTVRPINGNVLNSLLDAYTRESEYIKGLGLTKISDYLYTIKYDDYSYEDGNNYALYNTTNVGGCSVIRKGNYIGRNLDWTFDEEVEFVIKTSAKGDRHASIGVASHKNITRPLVEDNDFDEAFKVLPFYTEDGINDAGVFVELNVTSDDYGRTTGTNPLGQNLSTVMVPRFVLDNANSALDGVEKLLGRNLFAPNTPYEFHYLIADKDATYVVEVVGNEVKVLSSVSGDGYGDLPNEMAAMTNFFLYGWNGDVKSVSLGNTEEETRSTGLTNHSSGLERYNIISENYGNLSSEDNMIELMKKLRYSNTYNRTQTPRWLSEFNGNNLTIYSGAGAYSDILNRSEEKYKLKERDGVLWITTHTAVYDIQGKSFKIMSQETDATTEHHISDEPHIIYDGGDVHGW